MLKDGLLGYWWILVSLLYIILVWLVQTRTSERTKQIFVTATNCVLILLIPSMHRVAGYVVAVLVVLGLLIRESSGWLSRRGG